MTDDTSEAVPVRPSWPMTRRLLGYARPYAGWLALSLTLLLAMSLMVGALPLLTRAAVDGFLAAGGRPLPERLSGLSRLGGMYLGLALIAFTVRFGESLLTMWVGQRIVLDLRRAVFAKTLRLPAAFFDRTPVGRLMTRVTSDVEAVQRFVTEAVVEAIADLFMLAGLTVFMLAMNLRLAAALLTVIPPLFVALHLVNARLRRASRRIRERTSAMNALLQEQIAGMATIQLFGREAHAAERFDGRITDLRSAHFEEIRWFSTYFPMLEWTQAASAVLVLAAGGWSLLQGTGGVTLGAVVAFLQHYVRDFYRPLGALTEKAGLFQQAAASCERLFGLLDTPETVADPSAECGVRTAESGGVSDFGFRISDSPQGGHVRFEGVWFAYEEGAWTLQDVDFEIAPGTSAAFVGATGAGKSTLVALLARLYDVQRGAVLVEGRDVRAWRQADLRIRVGVVPQEPFLFSGTVAANIALEDPAIPRSRVEEGAGAMGADRFIERLPRGYDTVLGERGGALSAGEKQLIALARVWVRDPAILLVFDEATAHVDSESEALIQAAMRTLMRGRTTILIAHRLSTIRHADCIHVLRRGRLTARGTHAGLMETDPYYRHLCELLERKGGGSKPEA